MAATHNFGSKLTVENDENDHDGGGGGGDGDGDGSRALAAAGKAAPHPAHAKPRWLLPSVNPRGSATRDPGDSLALVGALGDCHLYVLQGFWAVRQHMVSGLIVEVGPVAQLQKKTLGAR